MTAPYRIFSLIESCPTDQFSSDQLWKAGERGEATDYVARWLDANPGRWFLIGEMLPVKGTFIGVEPRSMRKFGYEAELCNNKIYARLPHASGVPLSDFVTRKGPPGRTEAMPDLRPDPFNWTVSEMRSALSTAREWLNGRRGYAAAA